MVLDIESVERELEAVTRQWQLTSDTHDRLTQHKREARQLQQEQQRRRSSIQQPDQQSSAAHSLPAAAGQQPPPLTQSSFSPRQRNREVRRQARETTHPTGDQHASNRNSWILLPTWEQATSPQPHTPLRSPQPVASFTPSTPPSPAAHSKAAAAARSPLSSASSPQRASITHPPTLSEARSHLRLLHSRTRSVSRPATASPTTTTQPASTHRTTRASTPRPPPSRSPSRSPPTHVRRSTTAPSRSAGNGCGNGSGSGAYAMAESKETAFPVPSAAFLERVQAWQGKYEQQRLNRQPTTRQLREDEEWEQCTFVPHVSHGPPHSSPFTTAAAVHGATRASRLAAEHVYQTHIAPSPPPPQPRSTVLAAVSRQHVDADHQRHVEQQQLDNSHYPRINAVSLFLANNSHTTPNSRPTRTRESERHIADEQRALTFQPAVNEQSQRLTALLPRQFLFRQRVLQREEERNEAERREAERERLQRVAPFQPQLAEDVWRQHAMVGQPIDVTERLYDVEWERRTTGGWRDRDRSAVQSTYADCTFRPRINSNSTVLAYAKMQREASSSSSTASSGSSSGGSSSSSSGRLSDRLFEPSDDSSQPPATSPPHSPAISFRSRLLCLDTGRLTQHQQQSEHYQQLLAQHHTHRNHLHQQQTDRHCTFTPAILPPPQPASPHPVPGVSAYMHHRALINEQREWRRQRERQVFMLDAMERPARRGGTAVREFQLATEQRGRKQREQLAREREARRNRDH